MDVRRRAGVDARRGVARRPRRDAPVDRAVDGARA